MLADLVIGQVVGQGRRRLPRGARAARARARRGARPTPHERRRRPRERLAGSLAERELDLLLVTEPRQRALPDRVHGHQRRRASSAPERRIFVTDFRYVERAEAGGLRLRRRARQATTCWRRSSELVQAERWRRGAGRLRGRAHDRARARAASRSCSPAAAELVPAGGLVEQLRAVKDDGEMERSARAAALADELYRWLIAEHGLAGHTEREVARALERRAQDIGADGRVVPADRRRGRERRAAARRAARRRDPARHAGRGRLRLHAGRLLLGLHAHVRDRRRRRRGARGLRAGALGAGGRARGGRAPAPTCEAVDAAARDSIEAAGRGEQFGHGTGHGVGPRGPRGAAGRPERRGRCWRPATS